MDGIATQTDEPSGGLLLLSARCASCEARTTALCGHLHAGDLRALSDLAQTRHLSRDDVLVWQSEASDIVGIVQRGILKLSASLQDGREQTLALAFPGDFIGRPYASVSEQSITALTDCQICLFSRARFDALATSHPAIEHELVTIAFKELDRARRWLLLLGRKSAPERVSSLLYELFETAGSKVGTDVTLPLTRQEIAELLGTTIETVSRSLHRLKRAGVIRLPTLRSFTVEQPAALRRLAG